jgi:UDP-2,3-diacylglucosamine hydrolase
MHGKEPQQRHGHFEAASQRVGPSTAEPMTSPARTLALFISDLHLQESHPRTAEAFFRFLAERASQAEALYLLGDIFEYWAGDDDLATPFHQRVLDALRDVSAQGVAVYWIAGNRDFLVGQDFAHGAGLTLLSDPHVATIGRQTVALAHGDAQCTDDLNYMAFRAQVREPAWQRQFLGMPLAQRKGIIAGLREGSRHAHGEKSYEIMDVTPDAIADLHAATGADVIIHGHTHRPALHREPGTNRRRYVLPDWELDTEPVRGGWIAIDAHGSITRHGLDGQPL